MKKIILFLLVFIFCQAAAQTPVLLKDFQLCRCGSPMQSVAINNTLIFEVQGKLWQSDGTTNGTKLMKDELLHIFTQNDEPDRVKVVINGTLYFAASNATYGVELWKSNGTAEGTVLVSDIEPGANSSIPFDLTDVNGTLFFFTQSQTLKLWKLNPIVVPVELLSFSGKPTNNTVQLDWKTATELNTLGYDVERSIDGQTWAKLGFVGAKNQPSDYKYFDQNPKHNEVNYYRLCTVDIDGKKEYSKIVSVKMNEVRSIVKIYPSITEGAVQIETTVPIQQVWVSNNSGQIVLSGTQSNLNLGSLPTGIYTVMVKADNMMFIEMVFRK